ncbi:MAG: type II toxin-antitoxin system VapC family toxin [Acidimicrobiales bacterium]
MAVVADSHAIVWYVQGSTRLSEPARAALAEAEAAGDLVVSVATLVDLWYVTQSTASVSMDQLQMLQEHLVSSEKVTLEPVTLDVAKAAMGFTRAVLPDPWDRLIVATALALQAPLVSRDGAITRSGLLPTIW